MRLFTRIGMIGAISLAGIAGRAEAAWLQPPAESALLAPATGKQFHLKDAAGRYLALHFLTRADTPECAAFVRDYLSQAPAAAGVVHVFIKPDDAPTVKTWAAQFGDDAGSIYVDPDGALAKALNVPSGLSIGGAMSNDPATLVFGSDGKELFRSVGKSPDDHPDFGAFVRQLTDRTRRSDLSDYNCPSDKPLAVEGYDVVAYFTQRKAVKGRAELPSTYRGVMYHFATEADRRLFAADPERYLPTYGGWCASAMGAKGTKVEIDPTNFKIKDGRLFLFYRSILADALKDWNKHEGEWEPAADRNWKKLTDEDPVRPAK